MVDGIRVMDFCQKLHFRGKDSKFDELRLWCTEMGVLKVLGCKQTPVSNVHMALLILPVVWGRK